MKARLFQLTLLTAASVLLFYAVPTEYSTEQEYELTGQVQTLAQVPILVGKVSGFHCESLPNPLQIRCRGTGMRRSQAQEAARLLRDKVPVSMGWIFPKELSERLTSQELKLRSMRDEFSQAQEELASLTPNTRKLEIEVEKLKKKVAQFETDLSNRKRQLEILEEGLSQNSDAARKTLFEQKKGEVQSSIAEIENEMASAQNELVQTSAPLNHRDELRKRSDELISLSAALEKWITNSTRLVTHVKETVRVPDPDTFQLSPMGDSKAPVAHRSWSHIPWAIVLGMLIYVFLKRKELAPRASTPSPDMMYASADAVTKEFGIRCLGVFKLPV